jgi:NADH dehydrogenase
MTTRSAASSDRDATSGTDTGVDVVTGAFSYSGSAIARELLAVGRQVRTLTGHPERAPENSPISAHTLTFDEPEALVEAMSGATTLYNTYWVRFAHHDTDHGLAVANSRTLFEAAKRAGIQRIVHVSITNPSLDSQQPYFRGKALVEQHLVATDLSHAILRPAILFGGSDVLVNNIAWLLRRLPIFAIGGNGDYRIRGIHVDDLARLCVTQGGQRSNVVIDAVGPERPTFTELVTSIRAAVGSHARIVHVPGASLPILARILGLALHDVLLTADEYRAMAMGLADSGGPATGSTAVTDWLAENGPNLGRRYANELHRHFATN